jgi:hypothetical protein
MFSFIRRTHPTALAAVIYFALIAFALAYYFLA